MNFLLIIALAIAVGTFINLIRLKKRFDKLELLLAKKNLITFEEGKMKLSDEDEKYLKELDN